MQIELVGIPQLNRVLGEVEHEVFPTANARALNLVLRKMNTAMVRSISKEMGVQQKKVRQRIAKHKATRTKQVATLRLKGRAFNLIEFKARQVKRGVKASPWGGRRLFPHAFIATMPQGGTIVVIRQKRGGRLVPRMPIRAMLGPGVAKTAAAEEMQARREDVVREVYRPELDRQLQLLVQQKLKRRARRGRR